MPSPGRVRSRNDMRSSFLLVKCLCTAYFCDHTSLNASTMLSVYTACVNKFDRLSDYPKLYLGLEAVNTPRIQPYLRVDTCKRTGHLYTNQEAVFLGVNYITRVSTSVQATCTGHVYMTFLPKAVMDT